jgi:hypothetical protein
LVVGRGGRDVRRSVFFLLTEVFLSIFLNSRFWLRRFWQPPTAKTSENEDERAGQDLLTVMVPREQGWDKGAGLGSDVLVPAVVAKKKRGRV